MSYDELMKAAENIVRPQTLSLTNSCKTPNYRDVERCGNGWLGAWNVEWGVIGCCG